MDPLDYLEALTKALEGDLVFGKPLQVEDLNVTMQCRTFTCPQWGTRRQVAKIIKQLIRRRIPYKLSERDDHLKQPELSLTVGDRLLIYIVERA
jgi:hypothetical protein